MKTIALFTVLSALASAVPLARAQTSLTLYGIVDTGVQSVSGVQGGRRTTLASGIMSGSRWGLTGTEDMGGGWRALFTAESRLEADTGLVSSRPLSGNQLPDRITAGLPGVLVTGLTNAVGSQIGVNLNNALFDRQVWVGLVTPVGAVLMGRQYTPAFEVASKFDVLGTDSFLSPGQLVAVPQGLEIRTSNAVQYRVQLGGFSGSLMGALGEGTTGRLWGLNAIYAGSRFSVGFGHNQRRTVDGDDALRTTDVGVTADVGPVKLFAIYGRVKEDNPGIGPALAAAGVPGPVIARFEQDSDLVHLGLMWPVGPGKLMLVYNRLNDKMPINADSRSFGAVYTYTLSKRTDISGVLGRVDNKGTAQVLGGGGGFIGGVTRSAGTDSTGYALTLRHRF